ncbi:uncharacterized protein LOC126823217 [Patella vulgata]|uniref:uncharacterized protein LOC126823217 n=1 Tax=Patella vulgata TaxID=6465 RepID=UPI00217FCC02|nr:uncharacterized protein LOC126823217 [Patella vulgata]
MRSGEEEVVCVGVKEALEEFCRFISADGNGSELVGHNIKNFDCKVLYHAVYRNEMMEEFSSAIKGFIDTYLVYKKVYPGLESYSLDKLNEKYIKEPRSPLHDALSDVQLTRKVYEIVKSDPEIQKSLFSWRSVVCACSLQPLVKEKIITQYMKNNLVKANLDYDDLLRAHSRPSGGGIDLLFSEKVGENKKPRVTNCKTTIKKVSDYFDKI